MRKYQRRTQDEWQSLVNEQVNSELSAMGFCKKNNVSYPGFLKWKKKLETQAAESGTQVAGSVPAFVEITTPIKNTATPDTHSSLPRIELDVGLGIQLRIYSL